jgi:hypothetical protein
VVSAVYLFTIQAYGTIHLCQIKYRKDLILKYNLIETQHQQPPTHSKVHVLNEKPKTHSSGIFEDLIIGIELQCLVDYLTGIFGPFFMLEMTVDLITKSVGAYLCFLMPISGMGEDFNPVSFNIGLGSMFVVAMAMGRYYGLMRIGHDIATGNADIKNVLQQISVTEYDTMTDKEKHTMDILVDRVSNPAPVSPFQVFSLDFSTGLSALGLCLTYVIVLLQFRFGEK